MGSVPDPHTYRLYENEKDDPTVLTAPPCTRKSKRSGTHKKDRKSSMRQGPRQNEETAASKIRENNNLETARETRSRAESLELPSLADSSYAISYTDYISENHLPKKLAVLEESESSIHGDEIKEGRQSPFVTTRTDESTVSKSSRVQSRASSSRKSRSSPVTNHPVANPSKYTGQTPNEDVSVLSSSQNLDTSLIDSLHSLSTMSSFATNDQSNVSLAKIAEMSNYMAETETITETVAESRDQPDASRSQVPEDEPTPTKTKRESKSSDFSYSVTSSVHEKKRVMKKWGIPVSDHPPEVDLLERLVWVRYRGRYWWPAILYNNFREVAQQSRVWYQIPLFRRISLAALIVFDVQNPRNHVKVARLIGRPSMEMVENCEYSDFYKQLPNVLKSEACNGEHFRLDPNLYYDWHVGMDHVDQMLKDCLGPAFVPDAKKGSHKSWLKRAKAAERAKWKETQTGRCLLGMCGRADDVDDAVEDLSNSIIHQYEKPCTTG